MKPRRFPKKERSSHAPSEIARPVPEDAEVHRPYAISLATLFAGPAMALHYAHANVHDVASITCAPLQARARAKRDGEDSETNATSHFLLFSRNWKGDPARSLHQHRSAGSEALLNVPRSR